MQATPETMCTSKDMAPRGSMPERSLSTDSMRETLIDSDEKSLWRTRRPPKLVTVYLRTHTLA